jgi:hypothetical protein
MRCRSRFTRAVGSGRRIPAAFVLQPDGDRFQVQIHPYLYLQRLAMPRAAQCRATARSRSSNPARKSSSRSDRTCSVSAGIGGPEKASSTRLNATKVNAVFQMLHDKSRRGYSQASREVGRARRVHLRIFLITPATSRRYTEECPTTASNSRKWKRLSRSVSRRRKPSVRSKPNWRFFRDPKWWWSYCAKLSSTWKLRPRARRSRAKR